VRDCSIGATRIDVGALVTLLHPPGNSEVGGRIPALTGRQGGSAAETRDPQLASWETGHTVFAATAPRGTIVRMSSPRPNGGLTLVEVTNPRVLEALARIDAMSDEQIRELVRGEPAIIVEAGEGIIADRRAEQTGSERTS
jgi:hypothetical protein